MNENPNYCEPMVCVVTNSRTTDNVQKTPQKTVRKGEPPPASHALVTTSITIPADLFDAGKNRAEQQFRSFSQYVRNLIHQVLAAA